MFIDQLVSIDNNAVKQVSTSKSFGIVIDQNIMWHGQIDKITQKIASGIVAIERIKLHRLWYICNALIQRNQISSSYDGDAGCLLQR